MYEAKECLEWFRELHQKGSIREVHLKGHIVAFVAGEPDWFELMILDPRLIGCLEFCSYCERFADSTKDNQCYTCWSEAYDPQQEVPTIGELNQ